jgi:hypothetical protein
MSVPVESDPTDPNPTNAAGLAADADANTDVAPSSVVVAKRVWVPSDRFLRQLNTAILLGATCSLLALLGGRLLLRNTTATGGDMGAHVWAADFLQRELIPSGRLMGWSDDWFGGFPALSFYFPLPFWLIATLDVVLPYNVAFKLVSVLGLITCPLAAWVFGRATSRSTRTLPVFFALATLPYLLDRQWSIYGGNVNSTMAGEFSFAIAVSSALVFLGLLTKVIRHGTHRATAGVALAATGLSHLLPTLWAAVAGVLLMLCFLDARRTNIRNAYAVLLIAGGVGSAVWIAGFHQAALLLCALVIFFAIVADHRTSRLGLGQFSDACTAIGIGSLLVMVWAWPFWNTLTFTNDMAYEKEERYVGNLFPWTQDTPPTGAAIFTAAFVLAVAAGLYSCRSLMAATRRWMQRSETNDRFRLMFLLALPGALVATLVLRSAPIEQADGTWTTAPNLALAVTLWVLTTTLVVVVSIGPRLDDQWERVGVALTLAAAAAAAVFRLTPFGFRLWNNRALPFYSLTIFLLAALGLHQLSRASLHWARSFTGRRLLPAAPFWAVLGAVICTHMAVALPIGAVPRWAPAAKVFRQSQTVTNADGTTVIVPTSGWNVGLQRAGDSRDYNASTAKGWPPGNYLGYESRGEPWKDYQRTIDMMRRVGRNHGCGRAHWEYEPQQDRWGTTMALMLLPYWTDSCIGSMEGLYFESSASAPYHWLTAKLVSKDASGPQRNLPYQGTNLNEAVRVLQLQGIRYLMLFSPTAQLAADTHPDLRLVDTDRYERNCQESEQQTNTCPTHWKVYLVRGSDIVEPMRWQPAVVTGIGQGQKDGWLDVSAAQFNDPGRYGVPLAANGPSSWQRVPVTTRWNARSAPVHGQTVSMTVPTQIALPPVTVSDIQTSFSGKQRVGKPGTVRFTVDRVGVPVVVKQSWFPNFKAKGADGPYRLAPNLMVVIPRERSVEITFERSIHEWLGMFGTGIGIISALIVGVADRRRSSSGSRLYMADVQTQPR